MRTVASVYNEISALLQKADIEDFSFESRLILEKVLKFTYTDFLLKQNDNVSDECYNIAFSMATERARGMPVQYLLGEWDFMGNTYKVGEGVLIPRPETEQLCEHVAKLLSNKSELVIFDLCSGSGYIGITMQTLFPESDVFLVEKSDIALRYLKDNIECICKTKKPTVYHESIFETEKFFDLPLADVIISNPPYIKSQEIPTLQKEVQFEPTMALDGGEDGLDFYRVIAEFWTSKLKNDGFIAMECGEEQAKDITDIFLNNGFVCETIKDFNNIDRIIIARRKNNDT